MLLAWHDTEKNDGLFVWSEKLSISNLKALRQINIVTLCHGNPFPVLENQFFLLIWLKFLS